MNASALFAAAWIATLGGAVDCIDDGYDPLQPERQDERGPGIGKPIETPVRAGGARVHRWRDAHATATGCADERTVRLMNA